MWLTVTIILAAAVIVAGCGQDADGDLDEERRVPAFDLWITSAEYDEVRYEGGLLIRDAWQEIGLDVNVETMEWDRMSDLGMRQHEHDVFMVQWGTRPERFDPYYWFYSHHHSSQDVVGGYNIPGYNNPEFDELCDEFISIPDEDRRRELAFQMQEILAHDQPNIPLLHREINIGYNKETFTGHVVFPGMGLNSIWNWISMEPLGDRTDVYRGYHEDLVLLNPLSTLSGQDHYVLMCLYDELFRIRPDGELEPWAATELNAIDDVTYEVTLREGMTWHDGEPVTVEDVKFTYDLIQELNAPYAAFRIEHLDSVEIVSDDVLRFNLQEPFGPFTYYGLASIWILPQHIWEPKYEELGEELLDWNNPEAIGSGPFKFDYWRRDEEMRLEAFQDHFHPPKVGGRVHVVYATGSAVVDALRQGDIDIAGWELTALEYEQVQDEDHVGIMEVEELGAYFIHLNTRREPMDRVEIRRAMAAATPKQRIADVVMEGFGVPANSVVAPANEFWHNPDVEKFGDDVERAREILEEAGYEWCEDGYLHYPADE